MKLITTVFALAVAPFLAIAAPTAMPAEAAQAAAADADATNVDLHCKPLIFHHHEGAKCHQEEAETKKHDHEKEDAEDGWFKREVDVVAAAVPTSSAVTPTNLPTLETPSPMWLEPDEKEGPQVVAVSFAWVNVVPP
jgi:hypothetical protein